MTAKEEYKFLFKIVIVGSENVGKTCFLKRFADNMFYESYIATIGVDFCIKAIKSKEGDSIKLQIWDTAGQERFRTITTSYYRGSHGALVMYDVTNRESFAQVSKWLDELREVMSGKEAIILVGNKADDNGSNRQVSTEEGTKLAAERNIKFFESSAKCGKNVSEVFQDLCDQLIVTQRNLIGGSAPEPVKSSMSKPVSEIKLFQKSNGEKNGKITTGLLD
ncbi:ras-related protein Rab-13-like [Physella acuta]|uniref:ras-related protein Rab-13-like n=1 Tax=Physella acuta TaxID=109671 RepID=UPI0027DAE3C3|nr:ras-related protein Rab-13-like [Physella acuta]